MKYINKIGVVLLASLGLVAVSCSDYDDYNTVPEDNLTIANQTLWENISGDQQLTKFAELARKTGFSATLNSPRFFTIWAPVDNAIDETEYQRLLASDSATVVKQFFQQHMTEYNHPVSAALDSMTIISLNQKHHPFTQMAFDGFPYVAGGTNVPAVNGLIHKLDGLSEFHSNLYENIDDLEGCDKFKAYVQQYDETYLDVNASVIGPLVNGKQTYLDSVMSKRNNVIRNIMRADLENEDSTYCMLIPTDEAWDDAYAAIEPHYNYIAKMDYMDLTKKTATANNLKAGDSKADKAAVPPVTTTTPQDSLTCRNIVNNLVFSNSSPYNRQLFGDNATAKNDTVYSTNRRFLTSAQEIFDQTSATAEMSNGMVRVMDQYPFRSWESYNPVISTSRPRAMLNVKDNKLTTHNIPLDSLAGRDSLFSKVPEMFQQYLFPKDSRFFSYVAVDSADVAGTSSKPEFDFALENVRAATYHIYVITVPAQVEDPAAAVKPYYLRFYLSWTDAANKQQYSILPVDANGKSASTSSEITTDNGTNTKTVTYLGDPGRVNVFDLGEFTFPACYYGLEAYPSLMMMHTKTYTSSSNRKKYDQQMRVAGVYLIPKEYNDYWLNLDNE